MIQPGTELRSDNGEVADVLDRIADLLEAQDGHPYRVRAFRAAANTVRTHAEPVAAFLRREGRAGLERLPGIGRTISSQIEEYLHTGRVAYLQRLEGQIAPEDLLTTVPGIGETLAARVHDALGVETLEELEIAAHDGRLERVPGFGGRRVRGVREALAGILGRSARRRARHRRWLEAGQPAPGGSPAPAHPEPSVATLLAVDAEYRAGASAGTLRRIAPRRFNPEGRAWLPVLHTEKEGWHLTGMFSNTARAHQLGTTHDWVVIYYDREGEEDQGTVVTERVGELKGRRVVRGREAECVRHYRDSPSSAAPVQGQEGRGTLGADPDGREA